MYVKVDLSRPTFPVSRQFTRTRSESNSFIDRFIKIRERDLLARLKSGIYNSREITNGPYS